MQEVGGAILAGKKVFPIIWDQPATALPAWMQQYQPINRAGAPPEQVAAEISRVVQVIKGEKRDALVLAGLLVGGWLLFGK